MPKWPESVYVLDEHFTIDGMFGADENNEPHTPFGWMELEFRIIERSIYETSLTIEIWMKQWHRIRPLYSRMSNRYSQYDLYNACWACLGYVEGQSKSAIKLMEEVNKLRPK